MADDNAPWLAEARPAEGRGGSSARSSVSRRSFFLMLAGGLALLALVVIGAFLLISQQKQSSGEGYMEADQAPLITAERGPFKVKPEDPMGLDVEGQDQTLYAAGIGVDETSAIDVAAVPEEPLPRPGTAPATPANTAAKNLLPPAMQPKAQAAAAAAAAPPAPAPAKPAPAAAPVAAAAPAAPAPAPAATAPPPKAAAGASVQLGAFSTRARAEAAWAALVKTHGLIGVSPQYSPIDRDGKTLIRLRARGGDAQAICARLARIGDTCSVVP
jgi:cell division septation protein DedD